MPEKSRIKLSIDIQMPDLVQGDHESITSPITWLAKWLNSRLINGAIHIDIVKRSKLNDDLAVTVSVAGLGTKKINGPGLFEAATQFALAQDADIRVKAEEDRLIFEFTTQFKSLDETATKPPSLLNKCVLIAEDSEINALVFSGFMEEWGCEITTVVNGEEALKISQEHAFDLILMDIHMPVMDGNEAIRRIRTHNHDIPIIALTASTLESDIRESLENGANDYLLKPVASKTLFSILQKYLAPPKSSE